MKKLNKTPLTLAIGSAVLVSGSAFADVQSNPFALNELSSGYQVAAADELNNKVSQGGCASASAPKTPAKAAAGSAKKADGSCGGGMCGAMMKDGKMKPGMESSCGAMMKGKEGACGMMGGDMAGMDHGDKQSGGQHDGHGKAAESKPAQASCGAMMHGGKEGACGTNMGK